INSRSQVPKPTPRTGAVHRRGRRRPSRPAPPAHSAPAVRGTRPCMHGLGIAYLTPVTFRKPARRILPSPLPWNRHICHFDGGNRISYIRMIVLALVAGGLLVFGGAPNGHVPQAAAVTG